VFAVAVLMMFCLLVGAAVLFAPSVSFAAWTPLISSADFTGISTDVQTVAAGIIGIMIIVVGIGILVRVLGR